MNFILVVDMNSKVVKSKFDRTATQSSNKNIATITARALCVIDIAIVGGNSNGGHVMGGMYDTPPFV